MATKKQDISKHKTSVSRKPVRPMPAKSDVSQVFDIVPRSRVRANHTSRPVITANKPEVSDNTLATATAPTLNLKRHGSLTITPPSANVKPPVADTDGGVELPTPEEKGVSVTDLLAKRSAAQTAPVVSGASETGENVAEKSDGNTAGENLPTTAAPDGIEVGSTIDLSGKTDDKTVADAVEPPDGEPVKNTAGDAKKDEKPADSNIDDDEALARVLQGSAGRAQPMEHSEALKEEIKNLGEDGREHHELYGGKPVIVVHKERKAMSAMMWLAWFLVCLLLAVGIVDLLLDAGIIKTTYSVPYTDFIKE